jgi:sterol O-acyltransferase
MHFVRIYDLVTLILSCTDSPLDNGHLSEMYKTRDIFRLKLKQLEDISPVQSPSETGPKPSALSTSYLDHQPTASDLNQRRVYPRKASVDNDSSNIFQVAAAIESGEPLDIEQVSPPSHRHQKL